MNGTIQPQTQTRDYRELTDEEFIQAVAVILFNALNEQEVEQRMADELQYDKFVYCYLGATVRTCHFALADRTTVALNIEWNKK